MNAKQIENRLKEKDYDFLKTTPGLGDNIILLTTGGSHAYGTETVNSDLDIRGITLHTKSEILTMKYRDKPYENKRTDTVIYPLRQIIQLLSACNPNVIEMFGTLPEHNFILKEEAMLLKENISAFLSKKAIASFGGYATGQLWRLKCALTRESLVQSDVEKHIKEVLNRMIDNFNGKYQNFNNDFIKLCLDESPERDLEIYADFNLTKYPLRDLVGMLNEMEHVIHDYDKTCKGNLNKRNNKKDDFHLNKHAMHLIRLLIMGTEILEGKGVLTYRPEHDLLMDIRNGKYVTVKQDGTKDYSLFFELVDEYEKKFKEAAKNTSLPDEPDYKKIDKLLENINRKVLS